MDEDPAKPAPQPPSGGSSGFWAHHPQVGQDFHRGIAKSDERFAAIQRRAAVDRRFAATQREMRRAFAFAVWEAGGERRMSRQIDENIARLEAAQRVTEEKFQKLLEVLRRQRERPESH